MKYYQILPNLLFATHSIQHWNLFVLLDPPSQKVSMVNTYIIHGICKKTVQFILTKNPSITYIQNLRINIISRKSWKQTYIRQDVIFHGHQIQSHLIIVITDKVANWILTADRLLQLWPLAQVKFF